MPLQNGINSIIHVITVADVTGYTYTKIYAGETASVIINGTTVTMILGSTIDILVRSISSASTKIYLIGDKVNTSDPGGTTGKLL